ncbi:hypothetical protein SV7mr_29670 [Stieleria bergensis]|uniref:GYF domain-containing protein n=1 Tax=Stieleria bergensis TaxID=2528025 RepID=A0A517SWD3_9BACT|nr:hypothetical protein SV7mr_29670 [Planctomycetes bacterium SV_7m_r]
MSATWYYITSGWLGRSKRVGPVSEAELLQLIEKGTIEPTTLLQSPKTKERWVPMSKVKPAMERWKSLHPESEQAG